MTSSSEFATGVLKGRLGSESQGHVSDQIHWKPPGIGFSCSRDHVGVLVKDYPQGESRNRSGSSVKSGTCHWTGRTRLEQFNFMCFSWPYECDSAWIWTEEKEGKEEERFQGANHRWSRECDVSLLPHNHATGLDL